MPRLVVLDALGLAYRAYYAMVRWSSGPDGEKESHSTLRTRDGRPTNALFGFVNYVQKIRRELKPDAWALAWDGPGPTFRHELFDQYKIQRKPMPEDLSAQLTPIEELAQALGLPVLEKPGMEADDVMATLAARGAAAGHEVILVTGDKDMLQVVGDRVTVLAPQPRGDEWARFDPAGVRAKWGVGPEGIRDVLALMGDSSDNIPGVPGVGEKTAVELMNRFGTLDAIYARLGEVEKPALKRKLEEHRDLAFLSRTLATVRADLDLGIELDALSVAPIRRDELAALAKQWEIRRLDQIAQEQGVGADEAGTPVAARDPSRRGTAAEQAVGPATAVAAAEADRFGSPHIAPPSSALPAMLTAEPQGDLFTAAAAEAGEETGPGLEVFVDRLHEVRARAVHGLALLPVADGGSPRRGNLVGLALAARDGTAAYVPLAHATGPNLSLETLRGWIGPVLADASVSKVGHDLKSIGHALASSHIGIAGARFDVRIGSFLCDPQRDHSLEALARDVLGVGLDALEGPPVRGRARAGIASQRAHETATRATRQAASLWPLAEALRAQLESREQWKLYTEVEHPLIEVLASMERAGVALDVRVLETMSAEFGREITALETRLHGLAGEPINLASGPQLGRVLFETLGLPSSKKTKTGWSTDSEVLEALATQHEFPRLLLEWRALTKLKSTYVDALPLAVDPGDGRVHTTFDQAGAATGRLASSDPNLQNIPIRTAQGRAIRRAFVAAPGCVFVGADYSQIELRVLAHLSGDPQLVEAFRSGEDIHASTARRVFKIEGDVPPELRARAKVVNFGVLYGMGARSLAQQMGLELREAKEFIDGYFSVYAGVRRYLDRTLEEARERGWVATVLGRRRYLPGLRSAQGLERSFAERAAINTPIQGSAADLVKVAMLSVHRALRNRASRDGGSTTARLLLQVHDELLVEAPASDADSIVALVKHEMEGCYPLAVPLLVSAGTGATWFDVH